MERYVMGVRCFDVFKCQPYDYLEIGRGNVYGNVIKSSRTLMGMFKDRDGLNKTANVENYKSDARLHVKPEDYNVKSCKELIGNGIRVNNQTYTIKDASAGTNYETGEIEHFRLDLELSNLVENNYE